MRKTYVNGSHAARQDVSQAPPLRLIFHLLTKLLNQILGSAADTQSCPNALNRSTDSDLSSGR